MTRMHRLARLVALAAGVGLSIAWLVWTVQGFTLSDAHAYRVAAERLLAGADLYQAPASQDVAFRYAPWFAALWIPIAALPQQIGNGLWAVALLGASVQAVLPLARRPELTARVVALVGGTMLLWTAARGNVHPLVVMTLVRGLDRRSGPIWIALAASLKAVPILFIVVYLARRQWLRAFWACAITAALVAPMPLLGWELGAVDAGESLSLYYQVSPFAWAIVAVLALFAALFVAWRVPQLAGPAAAIAAILALPRLLLYDATYVLVGAERLGGRAEHRRARPVVDENVSI